MLNVFSFHEVMLAVELILMKLIMTWFETGTVGNVSCLDIAYFIIAHNQLIYFVIMYQRSPEIARLRHGRSKEIAR